MGNMKHCIFKPTVVRESVVEVLGRFFDQIFTLAANCVGVVVWEVSTDVPSTSLNSFPMLKAKCCVNAILRRHHRILLSPVSTVWDIVGIVASHEPNASSHVKLGVMSMQTAQLPASVQAITIFIGTFKFAHRAPPTLASSRPHRWMEREIDILSNAWC